MTVNCSDGQTATTTLTVIQPTPSQPKPTMGPHTGGGYLGNEGAGGG